MVCGGGRGCRINATDDRLFLIMDRVAVRTDTRRVIATVCSSTYELRPATGLASKA